MLSNVVSEVKHNSPLIYTKIDDKLACFRVDSPDYTVGIDTVQRNMTVQHKIPVLALFINDKNGVKSVD